MTAELLDWALGVLREHEAVEGADGAQWLTGPHAERIVAGVHRAVRAAVVLRHEPSFHAGLFTTLKGLETVTGVHRSHILDDVGPDAQLLPALLAAGFAAYGVLGPFSTYLLFEHSADAGRGSNVYGVHHEPKRAALSRIMSVAAVGPDAIVSVTAHALVTGMRDDPAVAESDRLAAAVEVMAHWDAEPPASLADHLAIHVNLLARARRVLRGGVDHPSAASRKARITPQHAMRLGLPSWLLGSPMQVGPRAHRLHGTAGRPVMPGLDAEMLATARAAGMRPLFWTAGGLPGTTETPASGLVYFERGRACLVGDPLMEALLALDKRAVPSMHELGPEMTLAAEMARKAGIGLDPSARYAVVARGLALGNSGAAMPVGMILRQTLDRTIAWTTTVDLGNAELRAQAAVIAELHVRTLERPELRGCLNRYASDHELHRAQASSYRTRTALRIITMLANLGIVGVNRSWQAGHRPT